MSWIDALGNAQTQTALSDLVDNYLELIGEYGPSRNESYAETAERLDCPIMRAAERRWWKLADAE